MSADFIWLVTDNPNALPPNPLHTCYHPANAMLAQLPHRLVCYPASVTVVKAILKGRRQLVLGGDSGPDTFAGLLGFLKSQSVATAARSVVKHNP